nr:MAG TPA: hypothetical protein [Caudoviricetes sp.]
MCLCHSNSSCVGEFATIGSNKGQASATRIIFIKSQKSFLSTAIPPPLHPISSSGSSVISCAFGRAALAPSSVSLYHFARYSQSLSMPAAKSCLSLARSRSSASASSRLLFPQHRMPHSLLRAEWN